MLPGTVLKGVTVGSPRYIWYTLKRWLSISTVQTRLCLGIMVSRRIFLPLRDGVSGMMLNLVGEKGSMSGLVTLPPNDVGRLVQVSHDETDESDLLDETDEERCISHEFGLYADCVAGFTCAGGVLGGWSLTGGSRKRSFGDGSEMLC